MRKTTLTEDTAYPLLGIFSTSSPVVYGIGDQALGQLLAQLLTNSGDTSILAWTGKSGSFNSCLPVEITVFNQLPSSHIPLAIATTEMEKIVATLRASSLYLALVMKLYDKFHDLSVPLFVGHQMKLPCLVFKLGAVAATSNASGRVFHAQTDVLGFVEITGTEDDLSRLNPLYLVHPWTDLLFGHEPVGSIFKKIPEENADLDDDDQSSTLSEPASFAGPSKDTESLQPLCVAS